jgi:hypothetical protein
MKHLLLTFLFSAIFFAHESSASTTFLPPDTTTSIVDKTAAVYLVDEGKTLYLKGQVKNALIKFRQASVKDPNSWKAAFWIGKCHYVLNNYGYSMKYATIATEVGGEKVGDEVYLLLGETYHRMGKIDSARINYNIALERLTKKRAKELFVDQRILECDFAEEQMKNGVKYNRTSAGDNVNSGYDEYNAVLTADGKELYFTSRRSNTTGGGLNPDDQLYFEDTYRSKWDDDAGTWGEPTNELGKINSEGFDALNYISADGLYGVMTLNTTATDSKKTTRGSDICELKKNKKDTWNSPRAISNKTINTSFFEGSATLTADGNTMYFVSDRKGEKSSTDIYVVHKNGKSWGEAKPLPMGVNTIARETTPFVTPDGRYLFFSSNGHVGMGGLDIFIVEVLGDNEYGEPINLGNGINTVNNDSHFVYNAKTGKGFISGIKIEGSKASLDIFEIDLSNFEIPGKK